MTISLTGGDFISDADRVTDLYGPAVCMHVGAGEGAVGSVVACRNDSGPVSLFIGAGVGLNSAEGLPLPFSVAFTRSVSFGWYLSCNDALDAIGNFFSWLTSPFQSDGKETAPGAGPPTPVQPI